VFSFATGYEPQKGTKEQKRSETVAEVSGPEVVDVLIPATVTTRILFL
jgi:hypothetical protein